VQVLFVFLALPELLPWLKLDDFTSACVALAFNAGAYTAESIRAGLLAVPRGQTEAARPLGVADRRTLSGAVFPPSAIRHFSWASNAASPSHGHSILSPCWR